MKPIQNTQVNRRYKDFPITSVCRADLESAGYDTIGVDDDTMLEIASKMEDAYCDMGFWEDLTVLAEHLGIRKHRKTGLRDISRW